MKETTEDTDGSGGSKYASNEDVLVDAREIARRTGLPLSAIYQACKEGYCPHYRMRRAIRFDPDEVISSMREMARRAVEENLRNQFDSEPDLGVLVTWGGDPDEN